MRLRLCSAGKSTGTFHILFSDSECQHNKYSLLELTLLHNLGTNTRMTRMCYSTAHAFHYFHYHQHSFWLKTIRSRTIDQAAKYDSKWRPAIYVENWPSLERNFSGVGCILEANTTDSNSI